MTAPPAASTIAIDDRPITESLDEDDQPRARWELAVGWGVVALTTILVLFIIDPGLRIWPFWRPRFGLVFANTTTNGGDMGAHVWWPWFLEHHWFPKLRLSGWAPDWYAGFPVGQYYFPLPAVAIALLDLVMPYNVAFKLVTISGPLLLPAAAYCFARGLRAPWPAPPAFAVAAFGMLVETRNDWQIYGGNIASTLAGEFSFTIGLALALFGLGALAFTLETGRRRWLPALLIAGAVMSHIVITVFVLLGALLIWLTRRPWRTWPLAASIAAVGLALTAVWLLPLVGQRAYTQSMRYQKVVPKGTFRLWSWLPVPGPLRHVVEGLVRATGGTKSSIGEHPLWMPWWMWTLAAVAIVAAGWYRRRSTLLLLVFALAWGVMFLEWPADFAVWNTRFLPFWLFTWGLVAAMGATEILRWLSSSARWAYTWIRDGDLQDARARAWAQLVSNEDTSAVAAERRREAAWVLAERRFDRGPDGWDPPPRLEPRVVAARGRRIGAIVLASVVAIVTVIALHSGWDAASNNPSIAIRGWAKWNYTGYEGQSTWPQFRAVLTAMDDLSRTEGPGRALWEPSSGTPDAINSYGTSLALELLPYFTDGRIGSMEGLYFESSATTDYHFLTVSECSEHPSNPVRGLVYGNPDTDFDLCVRHLQMLGVRYLMLWTKPAQQLADTNLDLRLVTTIPQIPPIDGPAPDTKLREWKVYEVSGSGLVVGMNSEPVVVHAPSGKPSYSSCWHQAWTDASNPEPHMQDGWECVTAPWWVNRAELGIPYVQSGPPAWQHVDAAKLASVHPRAVTPVTVTNVRSGVDRISFHVSETGKPVEIRESYFPNWKVHGARGPYRLAPNLMVVVPTSNDVTLTYGLTPVDWAGRATTLLAIVALVLLGMWTGATRFAGVRASDVAEGDDDSGSNGGEGRPDDDRPFDPDAGPDPPNLRSPAPAVR